MNSYSFGFDTIVIGDHKIEALDISYGGARGTRSIPRGVLQASGETSKCLRVQRVQRDLQDVLSKQKRLNIPKSRIKSARDARFIRRGSRAIKLQASRARKWGWR